MKAFALTRFWLIIPTLAVVAALFAPDAAAADTTLTLQVSESFEVDGQVYPADTLTLRQVGTYNPTATLNEVWVGKHCLGVLVGKVDPRGSISETDSLIFTRNAEGRLMLVGVEFRGQPARELLAFDQLAPASRPTDGALVVTR